MIDLCCTWKKRRRGLGGPLWAREGWEEDWFQATLPSLPELTLRPETTNSKCHKSGFFCHNKKPPTSVPPTCLMLSPLCRISDPEILTCPTAHMLFNESIAPTPPMEAMYCCTIYFALEAFCISKNKAMFIIVYAVNIKSCNVIVCWKISYNILHSCSSYNIGITLP